MARKLSDAQIKGQAVLAGPEGAADPLAAEADVEPIQGAVLFNHSRKILYYMDPSCS